MFRKLALSAAIAVGLISQLSLPAEAALGVGAFAPPASLAEGSPVEKAQFVWRGRRYCWYNSAIVCVKLCKWRPWLGWFRRLGAGGFSCAP